ncbi:antitoxin [Actinomycetospora endophytica]|uniref:Antitoxin n=1 Tax=Actinomycetospora endophytica TaxID=2291215 RepID=A0ABS8P736_9PSEU|nr:antitoxin [Actinomycetospora endophytica]MCD2193226.1 antitoxin [Actinomycetospora endophytica]
MDRDEITRQGKQMASDLRDTVSAKVSENEDTIKGTLGKAARWVDEKTGGKYSEQIGKAEAKVGDGVGWVASQGSSTPESGTPGAPGAQAADPAPGGAGPTMPNTPTTPPTPPTGGTSAPGTTPPGPITPDDDAPRPPQG